MTEGRCSHRNHEGSHPRRNMRFGLTNETRCHIRVALALVVLLVIFFWRVTLLGESFVATGLYFKWRPWKSVAPSGLRPQNPWVSDRADGYYPARFAAREMLHEGILPLWDPYVLSGRPLAVVIRRGLLYPLEILLWILPINSALGLHIIIRFFLAGFFMYLFLRELGVGTGGALIGGIVFTYNGFHIVWGGANYPTVIAPMVFWLAERLIQRRNGVYTCLLGLAIATMLVGGFVTAASYFLYALGIYYLVRVLQQLRDARDWRTALRQVVLFALAMTVGLLLVAPGALGELEQWSINSYVSQRIGWRMGLVHLPDTDIVRLFLPYYYGGPVTDIELGNFPETTGYLGILPWLLAVVALACCWRRWYTSYFFGVAAISYGMVYGAPFNVLIGRLPVMNAGSPTRMFVSGAFAVAGLAALGFDFLQQYVNLMSAARRRRLVAVLLLAAALMTAIVAATELHLVWEDHSWKPNTLIHVLKSGETTHLQVRNCLTFSLWLLGGLNLALARIKGWLSTRVFAVAATVLLVLDVFNFGISYNPTSDPALVMPSTPGIEFLQRKQETDQPFRILGLGPTLWPNSSEVYGLYDIRAHGMSTDRYEQYIGRIDPTAMRGHHGTVSLFSRKRARLDSPLLDLLDVRYVLVSPGETMDEAKGADDLILVYDGDDMDIYENPSHFPRAYAVCQFQIMEDEQAILDGLADGSLDPERTVWLEEPPTVPLATVNTRCTASSPRITQYGANEIIVEAEMSAPGFMVVSEITYPGWRAYVNGERSHIYTANYLFRAVYLPAGTHEVRYVYVPTALWLGVPVSLTTLAAIVTVLLQAAWRHMSHRRAAREAAV